MATFIKNFFPNCSEKKLRNKIGIPEPHHPNTEDDNITPNHPTNDLDNPPQDPPVQPDEDKDEDNNDQGVRSIRQSGVITGTCCQAQISPKPYTLVLCLYLFD